MHQEPTRRRELRGPEGEASGPLKQQGVPPKMAGELIRNALKAQVSDMSRLS